MKKMIQSIAVILFSAAAASAGAQDAPAPTTASEKVTAPSAIGGRFYVAPMFSYTFADNSRKTDDGIGGFIAIGKQIDPAFNIEALVSYTKFDAESGDGSEELTGVGLGLMVFPSKTLSGLFGAASLQYGFGQSDIVTNPDSDEDSMVWDLGLGYLIGPIGWLNDGGLRIEARGRIDEKRQGGKNDFYESVVSAGLLVPIGAPPAPPAEPVAPVVVVPVPADTDGDGVADEIDQCPGTPAGAKVNEVGCEAPPCKKPLPGERVSLAGCGAGAVFVLNGVSFEFDKARLTPNAKTILDGVSDELQTFADIKVELSGHTDSRGADSYNQRLSEARAESVLEYLVSKGIVESRMTAVGFGESQPVADNNTDEGREQNRRVELKIISGGAAEPTAPAATPEASAPTEAEAAAAAPPTAPAAEPATVAEPLPAAEGTATPAADPAPAAEPAADSAAAPAEAAAAPATTEETAPTAPPAN